MAEDLSFNPPIVRREGHFSVRRVITGLMRGVGYLIFAAAVGTLLFVTVADGPRGFAVALILLGTALVPWLINGIVLVSWGGALQREEATPRLPRSLALVLYAVVNALILFQIDEVDGFVGYLGWFLLASPAMVDALGAAAIAMTRPREGAERTGSAARAWILVLVTAIVLGLIVGLNRNNMEFIPG